MFNASKQAGTLRLCFVCGKRESWLRMQACKPWLAGVYQTSRKLANIRCETRRGCRSRWPRFGMLAAIWGGLRRERQRQRDKPGASSSNTFVVLSGWLSGSSAESHLMMLLLFRLFRHALTRHACQKEALDTLPCLKRLRLFLPCWPAYTVCFFFHPHPSSALLL